MLAKKGYDVTGDGREEGGRERRKWGEGGMRERTPPSHTQKKKEKKQEEKEAAMRDRIKRGEREKRTEVGEVGNERESTEPQQGKKKKKSHALDFNGQCLVVNQ